MKKLLSVVLLVIMAFALTACAPIGDNTDPEALAQTLTQINDLVAKEYDQIDLTVKTTNKDVVLTSTFNIVTADGKTTVSYSVEELSEISVEDGNIVFPDSQITKTIGTVEISGDETVLLDGQQVEIDFSAIDKLALQFKANYFEDISANSMSFKATVTKPQAFCQNNSLNATDMTVDVKFSAIKLQQITMTYQTTSDSFVEVTYSFNCINNHCVILRSDSFVEVTYSFN